MHNIYHFFTIKATVGEIFDAIVTPPGLNNWWTKECWGAPELGGKYRFYFTPEYDWKCEVIEFVPDKLIEWKMTEADEDWTGTRLRFELEQRDGAVAIHFQHTGWPVLNEHFRRSNTCWALLFSGLKKLVEKGEIIPFEKRA